MNKSGINLGKSLIALTFLLSAIGLTSCSQNSTESKKPSVREMRWLEACRADSNSIKCEDAIASNFAKSSMFFTLSNGIDFEEPLRYATGPHNVWCFPEESRCYAQIHAFNNSGRSYLNNPTAMIQDGDWKFHYAVLEGYVSFDNNLSSWRLEKDHFFDLNPGQSWRDLGIDEIWRAGFNIQAKKMGNLKELSVGKSSDNGAFSPEGATIPLCKKSTSSTKMIIFEDCRILNEWDYIDNKYTKKTLGENHDQAKEKQSAKSGKQISPVAGESCQKEGIKSEFSGIIFTCIKLGKNLYWDNGTPIHIENSKTSKVGETGPGGGIIFYDAGSYQSWGRYLEVAPEGWSGPRSDPIAPFWCEKMDDIRGTSSFIGQGKSNTLKMNSNCDTGASVLAQSYKGGGKKDWYLPSIEELNELCKFSLGQATGNVKISCKGSGRIKFGFTQGNYWSSTQANPKIEATIEDAYGIEFGNDATTFVGGKNLQSVRVRPIRSF